MEPTGTSVPHPIQPLMYLYTRREYNQAAKLLAENKNLFESFQSVHHQCEDLQQNANDSVSDGNMTLLLENTLKDTPDECIIKWILSFQELDLNCVYNIKDARDSATSFFITAIEQALMYEFSMKSILSIVNDPRLSKETLQKATLDTRVRRVIFHSHGYINNGKAVFMEYLTACVSEENAEQFLTQYLAKIDINAQMKNKQGQGEETLLMLALSHFSHSTDEGHLKILSKVIFMLIDNPRLDINRVNDNGWNAVFFIANCRSYSLQIKLEIIEKLMTKPGFDFNHCINTGANIITHLLDQYFWVLKQGVAQQVQLSRSTYCEAPQILEQFMRQGHFSKTVQSSCLLHFLQHPVLNSLEPRNPKAWYDTYRKFLADTNSAIIKLLLSFGDLDINLQTESDKHTALVLAINLSLPVHVMMRPEVVKNMLNHPSLDINLCDSHGQSVLVHAIKLGLAETVMDILAMPNLNPNTTDKDHKTPLMHALDLSPSEDRTLILERLVSHPSLENLNNHDKAGDTPMHVLLSNKRFEAVLQVLANAVNSNVCPLLLDLENVNGQTAFDLIIHMCLTNHNNDNNDRTTEDVFKRMLDLPNINVNGTFRHKRTLLHKCSLEGVLPLVDILLRYDNIDLNCQDDSGYSSLMYAVEAMPMEAIAKYLINPLCDVKVQNNKKETVFDIVNKSEKVDKHVRQLVNVVFIRTTKTKHESLISDISLEDQLKFLTHSVQREKSFSQKLKDDIVSLISCMQNDISVQTGGRFGSDLNMAEEHRRKLIGLRAFLCEEVTPRDLFSHLIADGILTDDMVEDILQQQTRRRMCEKLLSILPLRGKSAYQSFLNALQEEGQGHVAERIVEYDPNADSNEPAKDKRHFDLPQGNIGTVLDGNEPYAIIPLRFMTSHYQQPTLPVAGKRTQSSVTAKSAPKALDYVRKKSDTETELKQGKPMNSLHDRNENSAQGLSASQENSEVNFASESQPARSINGTATQIKSIAKEYDSDLKATSVFTQTTKNLEQNSENESEVQSRNPESNARHEDDKETQYKPLWGDPSLQLDAHEGSVTSLDHLDAGKQAKFTNTTKGIRP